MTQQRVPRKVLWGMTAEQVEFIKTIWRQWNSPDDEAFLTTDEKDHWLEVLRLKLKARGYDLIRRWKPQVGYEYTIVADGLDILVATYHTRYHSFESAILHQMAFKGLVGRCRRFGVSEADLEHEMITRVLARKGEEGEE